MLEQRERAHHGVFRNKLFEAKEESSPGFNWIK